jgi:hypothetical protein
LFEHEDDDEYDGVMGINDDEEPRILVNFTISLNVQPTTKRNNTSEILALSNRSSVSAA